ncbi:MAG: hypothetical protein AAB340_02475, partial [Patescibacteria group bacterium]
PARRSLGAGGEEKIGRAQIRKNEENFFVGWRALASGGGAGQSFRSKWVRAKFRIEHSKLKLLKGVLIYCARELKTAA